MSVQSYNAGRPILFGDASNPIGLTRREADNAGRPILFGNAIVPPGLNRRELQTAGRPILFDGRVAPTSLTRRSDVDQATSAFRTFPFNHTPKLSTRSPQELSANEQDLLTSLAGEMPTCDYKQGFSDASDPAVICPYAAKLQNQCMAVLSPSDLKDMTLAEITEAGKTCAKALCAEIKKGTYLKEVTKCFNNVCEESKEAISLLEKAVKVLETSGCDALEAGFGDKTETGVSATSTAGGFKTSTTAAAGATKTGEVEAPETSGNATESAGGAVKSPVQDESSGERIVWKSGVLVGALIFGSLFSSML